jgi:asparagine synthase (glutamine-hydrolysing)
VLRAYERFAEHCFEDFIGDFAIAIYDAKRHQLFCARDAMGARTLFYKETETHVWVASEPWAIAETTKIDERALAYYFSFQSPLDGQTLFQGVSEVLPGQAISITLQGNRKWQHWQPELNRKIRFKTDLEYAECFRSLLEQAIRSRIRSTTPVGVLLSGGLDSGSIACLTAQMSTSSLTTFSWVFDELKECDERSYIKEIISKYEINSIEIPCDDLWPYKDSPFNPNQPEEDAYRLLKENAFVRAASEGVRVLMTGTYGDDLYLSGSDWLADYIADGYWMQAAQQMKLNLRQRGIHGTWQARYLQNVRRRLMDAIPGGKKLRRKSLPEWITSRVGQYMKEMPVMLPEHRADLLGIRAARDSMSESFHASSHSLDVRHPYRDQRLIEFVLALPAYQVYNNGLYKHILRVAMKGILPESIRSRRIPNSLMPLYFRGVQKEKALLQKILNDPNSMWRSYVRSEWLLERWETILTPDQDGTHAAVPWRCISFESWYQSTKNVEKGLGGKNVSRFTNVA